MKVGRSGRRLAMRTTVKCSLSPLVGPIFFLSPEGIVDDSLLGGMRGNESSWPIVSNLCLLLLLAWRPFPLSSSYHSMLRYGIHAVELCHAIPDYALYGLAPWPGSAVRAECMVSSAWSEATFSSERLSRM
jgi:hypothetical protein